MTVKDVLSIAWVIFMLPLALAMLLWLLVILVGVPAMMGAVLFHWVGSELGAPEWVKFIGAGFGGIYGPIIIIGYVTAPGYGS